MVYYWTNTNRPWSLLSANAFYCGDKGELMKLFIDSRHPLDECDFTNEEYELCTEHDQAMFNKGYRFKVTPTDGSFESLYTKEIMDIGPLMRGYPNNRFDVVKMG